MRRGFHALCIALLLLAPLAEAAEPKRVLVVHSFGRDFAPYSAVSAALRADLARLFQQPMVLQEASLDAERGPNVDEDALLEYLVRRDRDARPDLVIAMANPAALFCLRNRDKFFPGRALLVTGVDRRRLQAFKLGPRDGVVTVDLDFPGIARGILDVLPGATTIMPVLGSTPLERFWADQIRRDLASSMGGKVSVLPPAHSTLEEARRSVAALPANSAVFFYTFAAGADGVQYENEQSLAAISKASAAPVFGVFVNQFGHGIVGGALVDSQRMGSVTAEMAARMLTDESVAGGNRHVEKTPPTFDWRELKRWRIPETRLPGGYEMRFRTPSLWEQHRDLILASIAIVLFQGLLITALLVQRARRHRAEKEALGLGGRLLTAHEDERRRLARELHDDLTQRLARLAIDAGRLERSSRDSREGAGAMRSELVKLSEDVHALSYRLHPSVLDDLGLVEALRAECDRVQRQGSLRVEVDATGVPDKLPQETSLCLFRIAQEALSNAVRHARATAVTVLLSRRGTGLQLAVSDNGSGFDSGKPRVRASLGLESMRERVRVVHGEIDIESTPGRGTTVVAWVPA